MIYNPNVCGHPKEGGLPFESGTCLGFSQGRKLAFATVASSWLIGDLNLYLNFKCENVKMSGKTELQMNWILWFWLPGLNLNYLNERTLNVYEVMI